MGALQDRIEIPKLKNELISSGQYTEETLTGLSLQNLRDLRDRVRSIASQDARLNEIKQQSADELTAENKGQYLAGVEKTQSIEEQRANDLSLKDAPETVKPNKKSLFGGWLDY